MTSFGRCVTGLVLAVGLLVPMQQAVAVTIAGPGADVNTETEETTVNSVYGIVSSIDLKQGLLVVDGRTYRFDPVGISFVDERQSSADGGLASLTTGSKVTLQSTVQDGKHYLLQIVAHD